MAPGRHDRDSVTDLALDLLDRVGLPDLSMRRLAAELEVQPSALYWHFASKQELLAAVADRILSRIPQPNPGTDMATVAAGIRDALLAYRDGAEVVMSTYALRLGARRAQDILQSVIGDSASADALFEFILGHATLVQQRMYAQSVGATTDAAHDPTADLDEVFRAGVRAFATVGATRDSLGS